MKNTAIVFGLAALMALSFNVHSKGKGETFQQMDKNSDGKLTSGEYAKGNKKLRKAFKKLDTDKDGFLSPEEVAKKKGKNKNKNKDKKKDK